MTARQSHQLTPRSAERLLDGQGGPEPVARLLSAAAAPGRPDEIRGEDSAVAAFELHHASRPAAARRPAARSLLGGLLTAKALALVAGACGTGAVALAAATGAFGGQPAPAPSAARVSPGATGAFTPSAHATGGPVRARGPAPSSRVPAPGTPSSLGAGAAALCRDLAAQAGQTGSGLEQALASSAVPGLLGGARYAPLVTAAGGAAGVPDYCALLLRLPALPQPGELTVIPAPVLAASLASLPAGTLDAILTRLPEPVLAQVLTDLPAGPLRQVLGKLPASSASAVVARLPAATAARVLAKLPPGEAARITAGLPSSLPSLLPAG